MVVPRVPRVPWLPFSFLWSFIIHETKQGNSRLWVVNSRKPKTKTERREILRHFKIHSATCVCLSHHRQHRIRASHDGDVHHQHERHHRHPYYDENSRKETNLSCVFSLPFKMTGGRNQMRGEKVKYEWDFPGMIRREERTGEQESCDDDRTLEVIRTDRYLDFLKPFFPHNSR